MGEMYYRWENVDAAVVCRQLGYYGGEAWSNGAFGRGEGPIWLDGVECDGSETELSDCDHEYWGEHDCHHGEDAGVVCEPCKVIILVKLPWVFPEAPLIFNGAPGNSQVNLHRCCFCNICTWQTFDRPGRGNAMETFSISLALCEGNTPIADGFLPQRASTTDRWCCCWCYPGPTFIKPDQLDPWIKDQIKITLLPTISHLLLPNFVSCGRACPSHMTQNLVTVGAKLWTADRFLIDPWSMDYADPVW